MVGRFLNAGFKQVQVAQHPVGSKAGFSEQVHPDGVAVVGEAAEFELAEGGLFGPFLAGGAAAGRGGVRQADAGSLVNHIPAFGFGLGDVHRAGSAVRGGLGAGHGVEAQFAAAVGVFLAGDNLGRFRGYRIRIRGRGRRIRIRIRYCRDLVVGGGRFGNV